MKESGSRFARMPTHAVRLHEWAPGNLMWTERFALTGMSPSVGAFRCFLVGCGMLLRLGLRGGLGGRVWRGPLRWLRPLRLLGRRLRLNRPGLRLRYRYRVGLGLQTAAQRLVLGLGGCGAWRICDCA